VESHGRVTCGKGSRSVVLGLALWACAAGSAAAQAPVECTPGDGAAKVRARVTGMRAPEGNVTITVYADDEKRFLARGGKLARQRVPTVLPLTEACFALPPGRYAIAVYHDANGDHDFNRKLTGLPAEGYGFSNNPATRFGIPSLKDVRFEAVAGEVPVYITLKY